MACVLRAGVHLCCHVGAGLQPVHTRGPNTPPYTNPNLASVGETRRVRMAGAVDMRLGLLEDLVRL